MKIGRVIRIHKGWYTLSEPYRRVRIDMNVIACTIKSGTYVSRESALSFHGAIPDCLSGLRLQSVENLDLQAMRRMAQRFGAPRLWRSVELIGELIAHGDRQE